MNREELIAPERYNLVSEVERFAKDSERLALKWENELGETKQVTYEELLKRENQAGKVFTQNGLKKRDVVFQDCRSISVRVNGNKNRFNLAFQWTKRLQNMVHFIQT